MTSNGTTYLQQKWENCNGQILNAQKKIADNALGRAKTYEWYFPFKHWETSVDVCECSGCPTTGCTLKKLERFHSITNKDQWSNTLVIAGWLRPHICYMPTNFKGRNENVTYLCKVCDYVAHQWAEAEATVGTEIMAEVPHTSDWVPCFRE